MQTVQEFFVYMQVSLRDSGIERPGLEARILIREILGLTDSDLIGGTDRPLEDENVRILEDALQRRIAGEPVSRILGEREFWGLSFKVTPDVLDPRPDTETLVAAALNAFAGTSPPKTILDLGTGSGCILISLLSEWPEAQGTGVDISPGALAVARENAHINHVAKRCRFMEGSWGDAVSGTFDLIVSNPPYIPPADIANLQKAVRDFDPILALDGGPDGLEAYKNIFDDIKRLTHSGTKGLFEAGISQAQHVVRLAEKTGFVVKEVHPDLAGIPRVVEISVGEK